jgi:hypothetical protein
LCIVFIVLCIVSPSVYSSPFPISEQFYRPMPQGGNQIAVNKYYITPYSHTYIEQMYHRLLPLMRFTMWPCHLLPPV